MNDPHTPQSDSRAASDDPRLTAYALGELEADDAAIIERMLEGDASLRHEVESVRGTAYALREGYAHEPAAALTDTQRHAIMRRPESGALREALRLASEPDQDSSEDVEVAVLNKPWIFLRRTRWMGAGLAAAAALAMTVTAAIMLTRPPASNDSFARSNELKQRAAAVEAQASPTLMAEGSGPRGGRDAPAGVAPPGLTAAPAGDDAGVTGGMVVLSPQEPAPERRSAELNGQDGFASRAWDGVDQRDRESERGRPAAMPRSAGSTTTGAPRVPAAAPAPKPADPAPSQQPGAAGRTGSAAGTADKKPDSRSREADRHDADGSRLQRGAAGDPAAAATAPTDQLRREVSALLTEDEIRRMDEDALQSSLDETARVAQQTRDSRVADRLRKQSDRITARLKEVRAESAEEYARLNDNPFIQPIGEDAKSTFSADVDTASYSNVRRFLSAGALPPPEAVRIEEMLNYFRDYTYEPPSHESGAPFSANVEVAPAPWNPAHRLVRIGLRGKDVRMDMRPATSLVFLIDVSGSMQPDNKLPLVKRALKMLVAQLHGDDRLGIVTYAGNAGVALDSCYVNAENREKIEAAIDGLAAGGSTNGAGGIVAAYDLAKRNFVKGGINRVLLCTDGDFNVGLSGDDELVRLIERERESGVFLSVLGFGTGNLKDAKMEGLADKGNGQFAYIDSIDEGRKVLVQEMGGTLVTIAKDVKFQVQFNDQRVGAYRLIGYENRMLAAEDFDDDRKDAGEIGAGHMVTALYEIAPVDAEVGALATSRVADAAPPVAGGSAPADARAAEATGGGGGGGAEAAQLQPLPADQLLSLAIRYKEPDGEQSTLLTFAVKDEGKALDSASADFRFAAAVAEFGMLLRRSPYRGDATLANVLDLAEGALGEDKDGHRRQFMELVRQAQLQTSE